MRALGRMMLVPLAGLLAALVAMLVAGVLGLERLTQAMATADDDTVIAGGFAVIRGAISLTSGLTVVPALLVIIVGEVARIRSGLYYVLGGGLALAMAPLLVRFSGLDGGIVGGGGVAPVVWQVMATAGFAGGLVYWLVAGRRA